MESTALHSHIRRVITCYRLLKSVCFGLGLTSHERRSNCRLGRERLDLRSVDIFNDSRNRQGLVVQTTASESILHISVYPTSENLAVVDPGDNCETLNCGYTINSIILIEFSGARNDRTEVRMVKILSQPVRIILPSRSRVECGVESGVFRTLEVLDRRWEV